MITLLRNTLTGLILLSCIVACSSDRKANADADSTKSADVNYQSSFDLSQLTLQEDLPKLMSIAGIKQEPKDSLDTTIWGYEVFRSSDPRALHFGNTDLSGTTGLHKNSVLFHYSEDKKVLICYEVRLYNQQQTDALIGLVGKSGTMVFKRTALPKGSIELDENGDEVKAADQVRRTFRVWENKESGLSYFFMENGEGKSVTSKLIVLRRATEFGRQWISTQQLDWYANAETEPLK